MTTSIDLEAQDRLQSSERKTNDLSSQLFRPLKSAYRTFYQIPAALQTDRRTLKVATWEMAAGRPLATRYIPCGRPRWVPPAVLINQGSCANSSVDTGQLPGIILASKCGLAICTKPLARQGMLLWILDRVLDTEGGVHDTATPTYAGGSPVTELLRTQGSPLHTHRCQTQLIAREEIAVDDFSLDRPLYIGERVFRISVAGESQCVFQEPHLSGKR